MRCVFLTLLFALPVQADFIELQQGRASLILTSSRLTETGRKLPLSDILTLTCRVTGPTSLEVECDVPEVNAKLWQIKEVPSKSRTEYQWQLEPIRPGKLPLPVLTVRYRDKPGDRWTTTRWAELVVEVTGPKDQLKAEIKGNLPLELLPETPDTASSFPTRETLIVAFLLILVFFLLLYSRRPRQLLALSADRRALQELERLSRTSGEIHLRLSEIIRAYLEERYGLPASRRTTEEFLPAVHQSGQVPESVLEEIDELYRSCDRVKYARLSPTAEDEATQVDRARRIIEVTRVRSVT